MNVKRWRVTYMFLLLLFIFPAAGLAEKLVVIDPGHGGKYSGTCGFSGNTTGICEENVNLSVGLKLRQILNNYGIKVVMTRETDKEFAPYLQGETGDFRLRMNFANAAAANNNDNSLFVSIHHNAHPTNRYVKGVETYYYDGLNYYQADYPPDPMQLGYLEQSRRFAQETHPQLVSNLGTLDRGIRNNQSFYVIRNAQMPAILVELGFMTNPEEESRIKTNSYQTSAALAMAKAVLEYYKVFEVHNESGKTVKTLKTESEAINYANTLSYTSKVFNKDTQKYVYSTSKFEVYHKSVGYLGDFPSEQTAINYAKGYAHTRVVSKDTQFTTWSNFLEKKYQLLVNNSLVNSFYDYEYAMSEANKVANAKLVNSMTKEVLWTNTPGVVVNDNLKVSKVSGKDRLETAIAASKKLYPNGFPQDHKDKVVILATGYDFADALSAGPLSSLYNKAPILLSRGNELTESVKQELIRLGTKKVVIVGGTAAISAEVEQLIRNLKMEVERVSGKNRYETNKSILQKLGNVNGLFVASGANFPDALAVAPIAADNKWGILLTQKDSITLPTGLDLTNKKIVITGGVGAVSDNVQKQLVNAYPKSYFTRLAGADRYETVAKVLWHFKDSLDPNQINITTGKNFPDALASAPLSIGTKSPLILIGDSMNLNVESYLMEASQMKNVSDIYNVGGVVSDEAVNSVVNKVK
ncbi:cell wall-binding repeat-containing protein [Mesobacillus subterraneus]|uniref:cell wall-binding repeat-containing protein n=1 Tax=Mesobacillus subterraneus TaxID=285983 RepID=UPI001CFD9C86|nr:cell wall-binding repeat-containing protein [Mesobacillus subterraneus]